LDAERIGKGAGSIVRICMATYSFFHWLPSFIGRLATLDSSLHLEIIGETTREPLRLLHDDAVDVVLVPGPLREERRITSFRMGRDELICVTAATHSLAARAYVEANDLTAETHLTYSAVVTDGFEYDRFFRPAGRYPARLVPLAVPEAVQELVAANLGISILSKWAALPRLQRGEIAGLRLTSDGLDLDWHVAIRQSESPTSPAAVCAGALARWLP
jgi:LysR family transcriptional regulator, regulator for metE and metH